MTLAERLELIRAGYSKDEIATMEKKPESNPEEKKPDEKKPESNPEEKKPDEKKPESNPDEKNPEEKKPESDIHVLQQAIKDMIDSNNKLRETIQASNLQNDSHGNNSIDDINHKAEDILKSIIAPAKEKEDKK